MGRREAVEALTDGENVSSAAGIVIDLENKAYARGWAAGVDSCERIESSMYVIAFGACALGGALVGALSVLLFT